MTDRLFTRDPKDIAMKLIRAKDILKSTTFRKPGQRKWRIAACVDPLPGHVTDDGKPGILVCLHDCSQIVFGENEDVEVPSEPQSMDADGFVKLGRRRAAERNRL